MMVEILDSTLREGEQTPYVNFLVDEKVEIARWLDQIGVEMIEAGDPSVSPNVAQAILKIAALNLDAEIVAHSLATRDGIEAARNVRADRVAIFYPTSQIHLESKIRRTPTEVVDIVVEHVRYARSLGLKVRFTPEDATRTDTDYLVRVCHRGRRGPHQLCGHFGHHAAPSDVRAGQGFTRSLAALPARSALS
jgi:2-isopropylmalate synthase